jgi:hypothetical protein
MLEASDRNPDAQRLLRLRRLMELEACHVSRPGRIYGTSGGAASGRSGHVLDDQHGRLIRVVVADAEDAQPPLGRERDLVAPQRS